MISQFFLKLANEINLLLHDLFNFILIFFVSFKNASGLFNVIFNLSGGIDDCWSWFTDLALQGLNEALPFFFVSWLWKSDVCTQNDGSQFFIVSEIWLISKEEWKMVVDILIELFPDLVCFSIDLALLLVSDDQCLVHDVLVWLGNDRNQEIKHDNEQEILVEEPNNPDHKTHDLAVHTFFICPEWNIRWINISHSVFKCPEEVPEENVDSLVIIFTNFDSKNSVEQGYDQNIKEEVASERKHVFNCFFYEDH